MTQPPLEVGKTYLTPGRTVGESDITLFAGLVGDFTPVHMDAEYCSRTSFGSRIAHGPLTMSTAIGLFTHVVETERRFYLCNSVDVKAKSDGGEVYFDVTMTDAWVWDIYRPARFAKKVRVVTFKDVNVEELAKAELELPKGPF